MTSAAVSSADNYADKDEKTLRFLAEAAHAYAILAPAMSRAMVARMRSLAVASDIEIHQNVRQRYCKKCSQVYVPGSNCEVALGPARKRKRKRSQQGKKSGRRSKAVDDSVKQWPGDFRSRAIQNRINDQSSANALAGGSKRCVKYCCRVCGEVKRMTYIRTRRPKKCTNDSKNDAVVKPVVTHRMSPAEQRKQEAKNAAAAVKRARAAAKVSTKLEVSPKQASPQPALPPKDENDATPATSEAVPHPRVLETVQMSAQVRPKTPIPSHSSEQELEPVSKRAARRKQGNPMQKALDALASSAKGNQKGGSGKAARPTFGF